jgi:hypothetical protein
MGDPTPRRLGEACCAAAIAARVSAACVSAPSVGWDTEPKRSLRARGLAARGAGR